MERICNLYLDKIHLSVTLIECIKKEIDHGTKVIVVAEEEVNKSIRKLKEIKKNKVQYMKEINDLIYCNNEEITIIIQGKDEFIRESERRINEHYGDKSNINIVSCYNVLENRNVEEIVNGYTKLLNTSGIVDIGQQ